MNYAHLRRTDWLYGRLDTIFYKAISGDPQRLNATVEFRVVIRLRAAYCARHDQQIAAFYRCREFDFPAHIIQCGLPVNPPIARQVIIS